MPFDRQDQHALSTGCAKGCTPTKNKSWNAFYQGNARLLVYLPTKIKLVPYPIVTIKASKHCRFNRDH